MNIYCCLIFFSEEESEDEIRVEELGSDEEDDEDDDEEEAVDEAFIAVRLCTYLDTPTILRWNFLSPSTLFCGRKSVLWWIQYLIIFRQYIVDLLLRPLKTIFFFHYTLHFRPDLFFAQLFLSKSRVYQLICNSSSVFILL